jgi:hypothetical protein
MTTSFDSVGAQKANYPIRTLPARKAQPLSDAADESCQKHNALSAFHWKDDPRPSIFATDRAFVANASGQTTSQTASKAVQAFEQKHGRSQGTVHGISSAADRATMEFRRLAGERRKVAA